MNKTLVFTATYNEIDNVEILIREIFKYSKEVDILIIDDNSPDGTGKLLENLKIKYQNLEVIIRERKMGLDTAHKFAFNYAKEKKYDHLITMDADLSHSPSIIPKMIDLLKNNEFVIGSRYIKGGKCNMSLPRLLLSIVGNKIIKFVLAIKCNEFTTSFRAFNFNKIKNFDMNLVESKGYSFFMETIYLLSIDNNILEIPISFENRKYGNSKIPSEEIYRTLINLFKIWFKNKKKVW